MKIKSITVFAKSMEALRAEIVRPKVEGNPHLHLKPEPAREGGKMTVLAAIIREFASQPLLKDCVRISVGTAEENTALLEALTKIV